MKVFLCGGAGFIGSFIAKELIDRGDEVVIHDAFLNYVSPFSSHYHKLLNMRFNDGFMDKITLERGDIRHKGRFLKILRAHQPDKFVLLAALPIATVSNEFSEDAVGINLNGTVNVLESLREIDSVNQFIYASSSMVYGDFQYCPANEEHPTNPICVYGGTKLSGELLTKAFHKQYGIKYTIIRPSAVYGPTDVNMRVSQIFVENALKGKPLILHNGGLSKLDFTYVKDAAHGFVLALDSPKAIGETFNITRGEGRSLKEFTGILQQHIPNLKVETRPVPENEKRPERGALDITKARNLLGYDPKYSLEDGLKEYVEFVRSGEYV